MLSIQGAQRIDLQDARIIFQNEDVWAEYEQQLYAPQIDVKMIRRENGVKRKLKSACLWVVRRCPIGKPNQKIAVLRGLALPTGYSVAIAKVQVVLDVLPEQSRSFAIANMFRVGRASPLKTAIFWLGFPIAERRTT